MDDKKEILKKIEKAIDSGSYYIFLHSNEKSQQFIKDIMPGTIIYELRNVEFYLMFYQYHKFAHNNDFKSTIDKSIDDIIH